MAQGSVEQPWSPHPSTLVTGQVVEVLASVGFTPQLQATPVGSLSGGWKMKLALGEPAGCLPFLSGQALFWPASVCSVLWLEGEAGAG